MSGIPQSGEKATVISETRVKQGFRGRHVLCILLTSLGLAVIAAIGLGLITY